MTMTTTNPLSRVLRAVADLHIKPIPWPEPESSIGDFCRDLGDDKCWKLIGPGLEQFQPLSRDVKEHLERYCQRQTGYVFWLPYMVGRSPEVACPTVFFCGQKEPRKKIKEIIIQSGILGRYPGFRIADSIRPPHMKQLTGLAGNDDITLIGSTCTCYCPTGISINTRSVGGAHTTYSAQDIATIGVILDFGGTLCFTTAAHTFGMGEVGFESQDDSEFEFDLGNDDDINTETDSEGPSDCAVLPVQRIPDSQSYAETSQFEPDNGSQPALEPGSEAVFNAEEVVFSSQETNNPFLDYALVPIKRKDSRLFNGDISTSGTCEYHQALPKGIARSNLGGSVVAYTGSRQVVHGTLLQSPSFMTSMATGKTQELWTVEFGEEAIARGDSGSLVADLAARKYIGHIIAGDPLSGSALVVPASDVFNDIRDRSGRSLSLATDIRWDHTYDSIEKAESLVQNELSTEILMSRSSNRGVLEAAATSDNKGKGDRVLDMGTDVDTGSDDRVLPDDERVDVTHEHESPGHEEALGARDKATSEAIQNQGKLKDPEETHLRAVEESTDDLEEALGTARQAVDSTPRRHPDQAAYLNMLSKVLIRQHERTGAVKDLEEALVAARQAVDSTPRRHPDQAAYLNMLSKVLIRQHERTGAVKDLEEALVAARQAVDSTPRRHPDRSAYIRMLGEVLIRQQERTGAIKEPSTKKSWAKAPQLFFKPPPDGPIKLGNVILDPACPEHPIATLAPDLEPTILYSEPERHRTILREYIVMGGLSAGTCAYEMATAHGGLEKEKILLDEYKMDSLAATYYASKPSIEALKQLRSDYTVRHALGRWSQHMYIVCGVRVAKNFSLRESSAPHGAADAGLGEELSVGANVRLSGSQGSYIIEGDIVLAYQLIKVSWTPWRWAPEKATGYYLRKAFLSDGQDSDDEQGERGEDDIQLQITSACEGDDEEEDIDWLD